MPLHAGIARFNRVALNKVTRPLAGRVPGFGVVVHTGRRSGREYRTPVNVFTAGDRVRIALTYGAQTDWVRNVQAAGGCTLLTRRRQLRLTDPTLVHDPERALVRPAERAVLALLDVEDFLDLRVARG